MSALIDAFRADEWEARQAAAAKAPVWLRSQVVAAHWLIMFAPEWATSVQAGLPIGNALDYVKKQGRELPPVVEAVWQEWHEKIEAARIDRLEWRQRPSASRSKRKGRRKPSAERGS